VTTRARLNRILAIILVLWGGALVGTGIARGFSAGNAYEAGKLGASVFGLVLIAAGIRSLVGLHGRRWAYLAIPLASALLAAGVVGLWNDARADRAADLAVRYGAASSAGDASLADRCVGVLRADYDRSTDPRKAGVPPKTYATLAPDVCALGVERGLVEDDGTMTEQAGKELTLAAIERFGASRFQTMIYNELAVSRYHLAKPGKVTRLQRCFAMGYGGFDAQPVKDGLPPRNVFFEAVRKACRAGMKRGLIPPSGVPANGSPQEAKLQALLTDNVLALSR
jgi:hypothetical protein